MGMHNPAHPGAVLKEPVIFVVDDWPDTLRHDHRHDCIEINLLRRFGGCGFGVVSGPGLDRVFMVEMLDR